MVHPLLASPDSFLRVRGSYTAYRNPIYMKSEQICCFAQLWLILSHFMTYVKTVYCLPSPGKEGTFALRHHCLGSNFVCRLSAVTRLFRIVLDITNPASEIEGRHWRSSITVVLFFFFKALWTDDKVGAACFSVPLS
jgi:hypothetical protein